MLTGWVPAPLSLCVPVVVDGITLWYQLSGDFVCVASLIVGGLCNIPDRLFLVIVFIIATTITRPPTPISPPVPDLYEGTVVGAQKDRTGETRLNQEAHYFCHHYQYYTNKNFELLTAAFILLVNHLI